MLYKPLNSKQGGNGDSPKMKHKRNFLTIVGFWDPLPRILLQVFLKWRSFWFFGGGLAEYGDSKDTQHM